MTAQLIKIAAFSGPNVFNAGLTADYTVRHPSMGGAHAFETGMRSIARS